MSQPLHDEDARATHTSEDHDVLRDAGTTGDAPARQDGGEPSADPVALDAQAARVEESARAEDQDSVRGQAGGLIDNAQSDGFDR